MSEEVADETAVMMVTLNGELTELPATISVADLIRRLAVVGRYAVELNGEIIPRSEHPRRALISGDRIEVVHAIGGG